LKNVSFLLTGSAAVCFITKIKKAGQESEFFPCNPDLFYDNRGRFKHYKFKWLFKKESTV